MCEEAVTKYTDADLTRADLTRADLTRANLTDANLTDANLTDADLTRANLTRANLTDANLTRANLTRANLTDANLTRADLTDADLTRANLTRADLTFIRDDFWAVLASSPTEVKGVITALKTGMVNGSNYEGDCACLVGTIANARHCNYRSLKLLKPNPKRAAERFFMGIKTGDTPENSQTCKIAHEWAMQWLENHRQAALEGAFQ